MPQYSALTGDLTKNKHFQNCGFGFLAYAAPIFDETCAMFNTSTAIYILSKAKHLNTSFEHLSLSEKHLFCSLTLQI